MAPPADKPGTPGYPSRRDSYKIAAEINEETDDRQTDAKATGVTITTKVAVNESEGPQETTNLLRDASSDGGEPPDDPPETLVAGSSGDDDEGPQDDPPGAVPQLSAPSDKP